MARSLWVARLVISDPTKQKISSKHGLDWRDVNQALVGVSGLDYIWDDDPQRGLRALVQADVGGQACVVVLYPVDDPLGDVYALGSAYPR